MDLEKEWKKYPVIHLDLSTAKNQENLDFVRNAINLQMKPYEKLYGSDPDEKTPGGKLTGLIHRAFEQTGNQVAVIVDEYDAPLLDALPLLYQSGYLTIKDYDRIGDIYTLSIPNQEVRIGYAYGLLPAYSGLEGWGVRSGFALKFWRALRANDPDLAMREMQAYLAGVPYIEGFKQKLAEAATAEGFYEYTMYLIFSMLNVYVKTQVKTSHGWADVVVLMPDAIYVLELKVKVVFSGGVMASGNTHLGITSYTLSVSVSSELKIQRAWPGEAKETP